MMTCRLLCALLVLALCCCPSVCVTATGGDQVAEQPQFIACSATGNRCSGFSKYFQDFKFNRSGSCVTGTPKFRTVKDKHQVRGVIPGRGTGGVADTPGNSGPTSPASDTEQGRGGSGRSGSSGKAADTVQKNGDNHTTEPKSGNNPSTDQTNTNADDSAEKTTATTTSTTTTTTTKAPSTTTTEAPTTTTTRAPSRLREIDGSLSSSAWVCAPLLLAVSALAYTTLG
ncbi:putative mucin TcMUCII [Trypanosoma cruzi]|uniref:Putative mucin TcMUCII n=1 Tax=Trypanosoma cruzi TaxID=5693 RepID=A0A2V2UUW7_TRYCR|nr:putative mucin TcMUCII [Trypanosoma cruzi]